MNSRANQIISSFSLFSSWEEKYEYLIEFGRGLANLDKKFKKDKYLISGCQSKVWLVCEEINNKLYFYADSDALITRGLVAIIVRLYSGAAPHEIIAYKNDLFDKVGLKTHLSMTRANGLNIMLETILDYANKYLKNE